MLIEVDADTRDALSTLLQLEGAIVMAVGDAESALTRLSASRAPPRVVVCHIDLPGLGGVAFVRQLRALEGRLGWRRIPVLALTGSAAWQQRQRVLGAGFSMHLVKPPDASELLARLRVARGLPEVSASVGPV